MSRRWDRAYNLYVSKMSENICIVEEMRGKYLIFWGFISYFFSCSLDSGNSYAFLGAHIHSCVYHPVYMWDTAIDMLICNFSKCCSCTSAAHFNIFITSYFEYALLHYDSIRSLVLLGMILSNSSTC